MYKLKGTNILGKQYINGLIDVVVLTRDVSNIKTLMSQNTFNINNYNVIISDFVKTGKGFAANCNDGAKINDSLSEFILFLNDDIIIDDIQQFMKDIIEPFNNKNVGIVGTESNKLSWGINGSVMCVRRELFELIDGFDDNYFFMWEDNDMCKNITNLGFKIEISNARCEHIGGASLESKTKFWEKNFFEGRDKYNTKWGKDNRIVASMIVGNEHNRYLDIVINNLLSRELVDKIVITCDNSDDETINDVRSISNLHPGMIKIHYHPFKLFGKHENLLRERSIYYALAENASIIIPIDADEILDDDMTRLDIYEMMNSNIACDFKICHMYQDMDHMRVDGMFSGQKNVRLFKVLPEREMIFYDKPIHCGSAPIYAYESRKLMENRIFKHYGYVKKEDILSKMNRQQQYDPDKEYESKDLYAGIYDESSIKIKPFDKNLFLSLWHS